ncbi:O-antigen ligase family protein [Pseudozobellia thermophila]|nr:O-antigen ligase family protein [Pseudozobellia thermophila]
MKALGLVCVSLVSIKLILIYKSNETLSVPYYLIFFGLFTGYTIICDMFKTQIFEGRELKYFYSEPIWLTFIALIIVENVSYPHKLMVIAKHVLGFTLVIAAIVSVIQVSNPLFLINNDVLIDGLPFERIKQYYENATVSDVGSRANLSKVNRFLDGYRLSIFSYISELSVGIDTVAICSILISWKPIKVVNTGVAALSTTIISFLSSSRWIMLNCVICISQIIWSSKNRLLSLFYFFISLVFLILFSIAVASYMGMDVEKYFSERLMSDSALTRLLAFEVFFKVFPDNPIFGTGGVDTEKMIRLIGGRSSQIHVGFLKLLYYYGLFGGTLYLSFMVSLLTRLYKRAKFSGFWGGFYALLTFFVANLTLVEFSLFYYGPLLAIIFSNHFYRRKKLCEGGESFGLRESIDNLSISG